MTYVEGSDTFERIHKYLYDGWNIVSEEIKTDRITSPAATISWILNRYIDHGMDNHVMMETVDCDDDNGNCDPDETTVSKIWFHKDERGNVIAISDGDGIIYERYRYNVYGEHKVINSCHTACETTYQSCYDGCGDDTCRANCLATKNTCDSNCAATDYAGNIHNFLWGGSLYEPETNLYWMRNRYYHKDMHRFINQDPIGIWGDANNLGNGFAYVAGMVIEASDPTGLETEVIFWAPAGFGKSSFGHVSVRINDISYSWSPGGMDARPASFYEQINNFRDGEGIILNISTEEEENLENYLSGYAKESGEWTPVDNNCTKPITSWINKNFDKKIKSYLPSNVKIDIINNGMGKETTWHPQSENGTNNQSNSDSSTNYDDPEIPSSISPFYLGPDSDPEEEEEEEETPEPEPEPQKPKEEGSGAAYQKACDANGKNCVCVSGSCPPGDASSGVDDPEDIFQKYIASKIISRMLKQGESDQPPVFKDNSTGPNGVIIFYRNPYYRGKDPMKTLIKEGHSGRGFMFVRNPFAPPADYNPYNSTADFWFHSGFNRGEIGPGWE